MPLPDDIAANLPPPRDDEPASLRRDIVDELTDHLRCALDREEQRQATVPDARAESPLQRVLKRFGNPAQVALRLWSDAMWDKIMTQRILIALGGIVAMACCVAVFAAIRLVGLQERALAEQRAVWEAQQQQALAQQQAALAQQRELAETLKEIREQSRTSTQNAEWVPVTVRLVGEHGRPSVPPGFKVRLRMMNGVSVAPWEQTSNGRERVRFPTVRYGQSQLDVESPWGDHWVKLIEVLPGVPFEIEVACPTKPREEIVVMPELELPEDLRSREIYFGLSLDQVMWNIGANVWSPRPRMVSHAETPTILVGAGLPIRPFKDLGDVEKFLAYDGAGKLKGVRWPGSDVFPSGASLFVAADLANPPGQESSEARPSDYRLFQLYRQSYEAIAQFQHGAAYEFHIRPEDHRAIIRLTDKTLEELRAVITRIDAIGDSYKNVSGGLGVDGASAVDTSFWKPPIPTTKIDAEAPVEWIPVTINLIGEDGTQAPSGFQVVLSVSERNSKMPPWEQTFDGREPVRFPKVHYGRYTLSVTAPWGDRLHRSINVNPGVPLAIDVACPMGPPKSIVVMPKLELPDDLKDRDLYVQLALGDVTRKVANERWETSLPIKGAESNWTILVGRDGTLHPTTTRAHIEPYLDYDGTGKLVGIRWPHPDAVPRYLKVCLAVPSSSAAKRLYELKSGFEFEQHVEVRVESKQHRAVIRFTETALENIRKALSRFDTVPAHGNLAAGLIVGQWESDKNDLLRPAISGQQPAAEAVP